MITWGSALSALTASHLLRFVAQMGCRVCKRVSALQILASMSDGAQSMQGKEGIENGPMSENAFRVPVQRRGFSKVQAVCQASVRKAECKR